MSTHDDTTSTGTGRPDEDSAQDAHDKGSSHGLESDGLPNPETGVGMGAGEDSTFEPEEDPEAQVDPDEDSHR